MGNYWKELGKKVPAAKEERDLGRRLFHEYREKGYLSLTNRELSELPLEVIIDFFNRQTAVHGTSSPAGRKRHSRWMEGNSYCFFNIRGGGKGRQTGDLVRSAMLLTLLRVEAVHLAPVMAIDGENLNSLHSHSILNADLVNSRAEGLGFTGDEQLAGFIEGAHSLNMAVGMDLPLTLSARGEALLHKPEFFRWIKLDLSGPGGLYGGETYSSILSQESQDNLCREINAFVGNKRDRGLPYGEIGRMLREEGYYPVPVNKERGRGVPAFISYDREEGSPLFANSSQESGLTTFSFDRDGAVRYFSRIIPLWQERYRADFFYIDSLAPSFQGDAPDGEAPGKGQVAMVIEAARTKKASTGFLTTGRPENFMPFGEAGFNGLVDRVGGVRQDRRYMESLLRPEGLRRGSRLLSLGSPDPYSHTAGRRLARNHFLSRFLTEQGLAKYEYMGFADGSPGFIPSLGARKNVEWREGRDQLASYHILEDIYHRVKEKLIKGKRVRTYLDDRICWWIIKSGKSLIIPVISVENDDMLPPGEFSIDPAEFLSPGAAPSLMEYDFRSATGSLILYMGGPLPLERIPYRSFKLYTIN